MTYKGTEYHSDVDGKSIKIMQEKSDGESTIKLKEERKVLKSEKQNNQPNLEGS